jgi:hypothetical protein
MTAEQRLQRIEDTQAIAELKAAYCNAVDGGWDRKTHNGDAVAALFVDGGSWGSKTSGRAHGRDEIRKLVGTLSSAPLAFHTVSNPVIKLSGDSATGQWHLLAALTFGDGRNVLIGGVYEDKFVRTRDGWKFEDLLFTRAFMGSSTEPWQIALSAAAG